MPRWTASAPPAASWATLSSPGTPSGVNMAVSIPAEKASPAPRRTTTRTSSGPSAPRRRAPTTATVSARCASSGWSSVRVRTGPSVSTMRWGCVMDAGYPRVTPVRRVQLRPSPRPVSAGRPGGCPTRYGGRLHELDPEDARTVQARPRGGRVGERCHVIAEQNGQVSGWSVGMTSSVARRRERYNNRPLSEPKCLLMHGPPPSLPQGTDGPRHDEQRREQGCRRLEAHERLGTSRQGHRVGGLKHSSS